MNIHIPNSERFLSSEISPDLILDTVHAMDNDPHFLSTPLFEAGPLNTEPTEHVGLWGYENVINVGNSGLFLVQKDGNYYQHFMPDASQSAKAGKSGKFSEVYAAALGSLSHWVQNKPGTVVYGVTNPTNSTFRASLLGVHYEQLATVNDGFGDEVVYKMHLSDLATDQKLQERLQKFQNRASRQEYSMESW